MYQIYLSHVEHECPDDCRSVFEISQDCFQIHQVFGENGENEMHRLVCSYAAGSLLSLEGGPQHRVEATR